MCLSLIREITGYKSLQVVVILSKVGAHLAQQSVSSTTQVVLQWILKGYVYVGDRLNQRIQKFNNNGTFIRTWDIGTANAPFYWPYGVALDSSANVFVVDLINNRIQKFTNTGTLITKWGTKGSAVGQFKFPIDVAVDTSGYVYVADTSNHRIQKFNNNGTYIRTWGDLAQKTVSSPTQVVLV